MNNIRFYPFSEQTAGFTPEPKPATRFMPEWYRNQPASVSEEMALPQGGSTGTIKRCMPVFDMMTAGYIMSVPMDIYIDATNPAKIEWSVPMSMKNFGMDMVATHGHEQVSHYPVDGRLYHKSIFRIMPFWSVETDAGYSTIFTHPFHRDPVPFKMFPAVVDTDTFISDGHLSMYIEKDFKGIIKQGTPLIQVIPFKREDWVMSLVNPKEAKETIQKQRHSIRSAFKHSYKEKYRSKKEWK